MWDLSFPTKDHMPPALKAQSLNHWTARQVPRVPFCFVWVRWFLRSVRLLVWLNNDMVDTSEDQENKTGTEMSWSIFVPTKQEMILIAHRHQVMTICWELFLSFFTYHNLFYPPNKWCALTRSCAEIKRKQSVAVNSLSLWAGQTFKITFLPPPAHPCPCTPQGCYILGEAMEMQQKLSLGFSGVQVGGVWSASFLDSQEWEEP